MRTLVAIMVGLVLCLFQSAANATEAYSELTGKGCGYCHRDPSGGSELTTEGKDYLGKLTLADEDGLETASQLGTKGPLHFLRLIAGYLHILMGIFWFGTILYVHLVLKPAYAAHGLPRGEVKLGLVSICVMAVTGTILTVSRVPSFSFFFETRFGVLLMIKIILFLIMTGTALFVVIALGPKLKAAHAVPQRESPQAITEEQLRFFDGTEGRAAYFSYAGRVFDASHSTQWTGGKHFGRHSAGEDLTEAIKQAPHGEDKVMLMPRVGDIVAARENHPCPVHARRFFFLAYLNLILVILIILILALWRWW